MNEPWTDELRERSTLTTLNVVNMIVGTLPPMVAYALGAVTGLMNRKPGSTGTTGEELVEVAEKLLTSLAQIEDPEQRQWVEALATLATAASRVPPDGSAPGTIRARFDTVDRSAQGMAPMERYRMTLLGVEAALEAHPPRRGLGSEKSR
jgi:hypothetical protein